MTKYRRTAVALAAVAAALLVVAATGLANGKHGKRNPSQANAQVAELYQLQAAFHRAATLQSPNDVPQRVVEMLALWTEDGSLTLGTSTFQGKGQPGTASCAPGSGTLCDFFTNVAPPFHNDWISLAPAFKTGITVHGKKATLYYECHYFAAGTWEPKVRFTVEATAKKQHGRWLLASSNVTTQDISYIPYP
jgi:hypothetical protein